VDSGAHLGKAHAASAAVVADVVYAIMALDMRKVGKIGV
jgi:hypothetical protein